MVWYPAKSLEEIVAQLVLRLLVNALSIAVIARILPGITVEDNSILTFIIIGLVFGVVNALVKPIIALLTCPLVILTLGFFILVLNGLMLLLTSAIMGSTFQVEGLGTAILGGIIVSIINMVMEGMTGQSKTQVEVRTRR
jgi:putative membrane protein